MPDEQVVVEPVVIEPVVIPNVGDIKAGTDPAALPDPKSVEEAAKAKAEAATAKATATALQKQLDEAPEKMRTEMLTAFQKALGITPEGGKVVTIEELQKTLADTTATKDAKIKELQLGNAMGSAISSAAARPSVRDAINGAGILSSLDPNSDTFQADVDAKVKEYVEKYPEFKAGTPAPQSGQSGANFNGTPPETQTVGDDVDELRKKRRESRAAS